MIEGASATGKKGKPDQTKDDWGTQGWESGKAKFQFQTRQLWKASFRW